MVQTEDVSLIEWVFKGFCGLCIAVGGYLWTTLMGDMKDLRTDIAIIKQDAAAQAVYNEREFEKRETIQYSLSRIHERLDKLVEMVGGKH